ncbi:uncharacterized protein LOC126367849 isoform X1 [Pectinophora gossypiella]|uniref:uncharacterized protein LOC126367849 isoform X1 n=1 Tax=Pectinophora gossypiella TaxID=13191 RepID=UPI00214E0DB8|nr:uncharacterized protein LOC126367849 isoform X1 [Pectinophora gossypiella]
MNLKLNNDARRRSLHPLERKERTAHAIKEERRRTGRYIAILVGICLFLLAIYHAWVRRIPIVASLVVPALIMFVYVGWVLYTASRDKHKLLDAEAALNAAQEAEMEAMNEAQNNIEISVIPGKEIPKVTSPDVHNWTEISTALLKEVSKDERTFVKPVILVNDKLHEDSDQAWTNLVESVVNNEKFKGFPTRRKFRRKFCRSKRNAVFKRSYSIA